MTVAINKTSLKQQRDQLEMYLRFLPSLEMKRQQLIAEYQRACGQLAMTEQETRDVHESHRGLYALLGASEQDISGLVRVASVEVAQENVLGTYLPVLIEVRFQVTEYSMLAKPFWVDLVVELLQRLGRLKVRENIERERGQRLKSALRRITQRVNLFEKVLVPQTRENIQRIRVHLADAERAAVVRSKIAKAKRRGDESNRRYF